MKKWILGGIFLLLLVSGIFVVRGVMANPLAQVRVLDPAGAPVPGVVVKPYAIRGSNGAHFFWQGKWAGQFSAEPREVVTDARGIAVIEYPAYLHEGIRSVGVTFTAEHENYPLLDATVSVPGPLPTSAPVWMRVRHMFLGLVDRLRTPVEDVQLTPGAKIVASGYLAEASRAPVKVYAQVSTSRDGTFRSDGWRRESAQLFTARMPLVPIFLQLVHRAEDGTCFFSEVQAVEPSAKETNVFFLPLRRGITLKGRLNDTVPRPVRNGWVSVRHVHGPGGNSTAAPLIWDDYTSIEEDGSFQIASIAPGRIEVIALCDGYLSSSPRGSNRGILSPQVFHLTNSAGITMPMEPTAVAAIKVLDPEGRPLPRAKVHFWPNERWAEWSATIIGTGWHRTGELLDVAELDRHMVHAKDFRQFTAETDETGLAVIPELPAHADRFAVEHASFELPLNEFGDRAGIIRLMPERTNHTTVKLQQRGTEILE